MEPKKWTKEEIEYLKENWNKLEIENFKLNRSYKAIFMKAKDLDIGPNQAAKHRTWTEKETKTLIDLYQKGHTPPTMANYIDRSSQACSGKIERMIKDGVLMPRSDYRVSC